MNKITIVTSNTQINKTHEYTNNELKTTSNASVYKYYATTVDVDDLKNLSKRIHALDPNEAIILGSHKNNLPQYVGGSKAKADGKAVFARLQEDYNFSNIGLFDYDVDEETPDNLRYNTPVEYINALASVFPAINDAALLIKNSSSANLFHKDTELSPASPKKHVYFQAKDASDIPRFIKVLEARCWLNGLGYSKYSKTNSKSGMKSKLNRTIFDTAVFQSNRLVFEAPPTLCDGITQSHVEHILIEGNTLDTSLLLDLTEEEEREYAVLTGKGSYTIKKEGSKEVRVYKQGSVYDDTLYDLTDDLQFRKENGEMTTLRMFKATSTDTLRVHSPFRWDFSEEFTYTHSPSAILIKNDKDHVKLKEWCSGTTHYPPHCKALFEKEEKTVEIIQQTNKTSNSIQTKINTQQNNIRKASLRVMQAKMVDKVHPEIDELTTQLQECLDNKDFKKADSIQKKIDTKEKKQDNLFDDAQENKVKFINNIELFCIEIDSLTDELNKVYDDINHRQMDQLRKDHAANEAKTNRFKDSPSDEEWSWCSSPDRYYKYSSIHQSWVILSQQSFRKVESLHKAGEFNEFIDELKRINRYHDLPIYTFGEYDNSRFLNLMRTDSWLLPQEGNVHEAFKYLMMALSNSNPEIEKHILHCIRRKYLNPEDTQIPSLNFYYQGGVGRGSLLMILSKIFTNGTLAVQKKDVIGDFNAVIEGKVVVVIDELAANKTDMDTIKSRFGARTFPLTGKGKDTIDVPATQWYITSTNGYSPGVLLGGTDADRRFSIIKVEKSLKAIVAEQKNISEQQAKSWLENIHDTIFNNPDEIAKWLQSIIDLPLSDDTPTAWHDVDYEASLSAGLTIFEDICKGTFHEDFQQISVMDMYETYKTCLTDNYTDSYSKSLKKFTEAVITWTNVNKMKIILEKTKNKTVHGIILTSDTFMTEAHNKTISKYIKLSTEEKTKLAVNTHTLKGTFHED